MKLDQGHSKGSLQDSRRIVHSKPRPLDCYRNNLWCAWTIKSKPAPLLSWIPSMTVKNSRRSFICMRQPRQQTRGPTVTNPTIAEAEQGDPTSQHDDDGDEITYVLARKGRLNAPQLQAQLSRLSDRTRLRPCQPKEGGNTWRGFVPHACLTKLALPLGGGCGQCLSTA